MFMPTLPIWELAARGAIIFLLVLVLLRIFGKRQVGQMTPYDLTVLLLISEAVSNGLSAGDNSVPSANVIFCFALWVLKQY